MMVLVIMMIMFRMTMMVMVMHVADLNVFVCTNTVTRTDEHSDFMCTHTVLRTDALMQTQTCVYKRTHKDKPTQMIS